MSSFNDLQEFDSTSIEVDDIKIPDEVATIEDIQKDWNLLLETIVLMSGRIKALEDRVSKLEG